MCPLSIKVDRIENSSGLGLTLLIDFRFGFNRLETFTIFQVQVHRVSKNPLGLGWVFGINGF